MLPLDDNFEPAGRPPKLGAMFYPKIKVACDALRDTPGVAFRLRFSDA